MIRTSLPFMWGGSLGLLQKPHLTLLPSNTLEGPTRSFFAFLSFSHFRLRRQLDVWVLNSWKAISSLHLQAFLPTFLPGGAFPGTLAVAQLLPFFVVGAFSSLYLWI